MAFDFTKILDAAGPILQTFAPTIATALGGPLAGAGVKFLTDALLPGNENPSDNDLVAAIQGADPAALARLKEIDADFKVEMKKLDIDIIKIAAADRDSARDREKTVGGWTNPVLAGMVMIGFFAIAGLVLAGEAGTDPVSATLVGAVVGYASAKADQVIAYYFGSSAGSKQKTDAMVKAIGR
ncbi:MAG: hypothetical protein V3U60_16440 [Gammaproteobacteria bacterium]